MANKPLKSIKWPGLSDTYTVPVVDDTLSIQGKAADAKKTGDEIAEIKSDLAELGGGVPTTVRQAIYNLLNAGAYASTGHTSDIATVLSWASTVTAISLNKSSTSITGAGTEQLTATTTPSGGAVSWSSSDTSVATVSSSGLVTSVGNGTAVITASCGDLSATCTVTVSGFATLSSISAVYTQSGEVYTDDSLNVLKSGLVVTAHYSDSSTATVESTDYTLSGTLTSGTSTITVTYEGKTTTFNVTVTAPLYSVSDFAESSITIGGKTATLKKENNIYTYNGKVSEVVYIYPNGSLNSSRSSTLWFATPNNKPIRWEIDIVSWSNPNSSNVTLSGKFSKSDSTGNVVNAEYIMTANGSGSDNTAVYENAEYPTRNLSALAVQTYNSSPSTDVAISFKVRLFCDGVRYL